MQSNWVKANQLSTVYVPTYLQPYYGNGVFGITVKFIVQKLKFCIRILSVRDRSQDSTSRIFFLVRISYQFQIWNKFDVNKHACIITTNAEIKAGNLICYLKEEWKTFVKGTSIIIIWGHHHSEGGILGETDKGLGFDSSINKFRRDLKGEFVKKQKCKKATIV